jgi:hypothetical protein
MADKIENPTKNAEDLTVEEMAVKRAEITKYYEDHIPSLETQLQYETLLRDIEKTRAERLQAQMFITKSMAEPPAAPAGPKAPMPSAAPTAVPPLAPTPKRTLKKKENATE